jgi:hypothetical protein
MWPGSLLPLATAGFVLLTGDTGPCGDKTENARVNDASGSWQLLLLSQRGHW